MYTLHSRQLKARIEEALSRNVQTVLVRLEEQIGSRLSGDACAHARRFVVSSIPHGQRAVPSATAASLRLRCAHDIRRRGRCVYTLNADVPLDSLLVWVAVRCLSFVLCEAGVTRSLGDGATRDENLERGHDHHELVRGLATIAVVKND